MRYYTIYGLYFASMLFALGSSMYRFRKVDTAAKILSVLICCAFLVESAAYYLAKTYRNNLPLYTVYCIVEFGIISFYFNYVIDVFRNRNLGIYIALVGIILGIVNFLFVQDINSLNSNFLFFEGIAAIGMSLFAFFRMLINEDTLSPFRYPHFWFISIIIFFWSVTFLNWGLHNYLNIQMQNAAMKINLAFLLIGTFTYCCFGTVFLLYSKMQSNHD